VDFNKTSDALDRALTRDPVAKAFRRVRRSRSFKELSTVRNYLNHRSAPPRHMYLTTGDGAPPDLWRMRLHGMANIPLEPDTTGHRRQSMSESLALLMSRLEDHVLRSL
jgi:hypothetical protein